MKDIYHGHWRARSQVPRLVCEPLLVILSLVTDRILEKESVLEMFS